MEITDNEILFGYLEAEDEGFGIINEDEFECSVINCEECPANDICKALATNFGTSKPSSENTSKNYQEWYKRMKDYIAIKDKIDIVKIYEKAFDERKMPLDIFNKELEKIS